MKCTMTLKFTIVTLEDVTTLKKEHGHLKYVKKHETKLDNQSNTSHDKG